MPCDNKITHWVWETQEQRKGHYICRACAIARHMCEDHLFQPRDVSRDQLGRLARMGRFKCECPHASHQERLPEV